jgi:hypothetical protein
VVLLQHHWTFIDCHDTGYPKLGIDDPFNLLLRDLVLAVEPDAIGACREVSRIAYCKSLELCHVLKLNLSQLGLHLDEEYEESWVLYIVHEFVIGVVESGIPRLLSSVVAF